jgi:hypothetical protein
MYTLSILFVALAALYNVAAAPSTITVSTACPKDAAPPVLESFVSYSLEFAFFPDFAGNLSHPNRYSYNLLNNIGSITGSNPVIRVGGNTQDYAVYDADLKVATSGSYTAASADYPTILSIGKSYFESYHTWPNTKFIHGFNMGRNASIAYDTLIKTSQLACEALKGGKLEYWELGNEPDLFKTSAQGPVRPRTWDEQAYVDEWLNKTSTIRAQVTRYCTDEPYSYIAPSFAGTKNSLDPVKPWHLGLDKNHDIAQISSHNYIGGATQPGVTLQKTLMNHSSTVQSISSQLNVSRLLSNYSLPFILGETNSLYNQGRPGLSDTFGAALWGVDFNLWCASQGIQRVHMHQGTNYRYQSWQPIDTNRTTKGTKAPYYGNIAVASVLGNIKDHKTTVQNLPLSSEFEAAYAVYTAGDLKRIAVINLREYNYTTQASKKRPAVDYTFTIPGIKTRTINVRRLMANGSDAITGVTWDGYSYNHELDDGRPVKLDNVTVGETAKVASGGRISVEVPLSSVAVLDI